MHTHTHPASTQQRLSSWSTHPALHQHHVMCHVSPSFPHHHTQHIQTHDTLNHKHTTQEVKDGLLECGHQFVGRPFQQEIVVHNLGRKAQSLTWVSERFEEVRKVFGKQQGTGEWVWVSSLK